MLNNDTMLLRHIKPAMMQQGRPSRIAFMPNKYDNGILSVNNGDRISAEDALNKYNENTAGKPAVCVYGVYVRECDVTIFTITEDGDKPPYHCSINFHTTEHNQLVQKAIKLLNYALKHNQLYP